MHNSDTFMKSSLKLSLNRSRVQTITCLMKTSGTVGSVKPTYRQHKSHCRAMFRWLGHRILTSGGKKEEDEKRGHSFNSHGNGEQQNFLKMVLGTVDVIVDVIVLCLHVNGMALYWNVPHPAWKVTIPPSLHSDSAFSKSCFFSCFHWVTKFSKSCASTDSTEN